MSNEARLDQDEDNQSPIKCVAGASCVEIDDPHPFVMSASQSPFALLIAITQYKYPIQYRKLHSPTRDAEAVSQYLQEEIGATPSRIRKLYDSSATRKAIISELKYLARRKDIQKDDPIIIYYAGHGCEVKAPKGWDDAGEYIQALVPHDFNESNLDTALPDRTIGALLAKIAAAHGDNITVIFDCCHSGSITRGETSAAHGNIRGLGRLEGIISPQIDEEIWADVVENHRGLNPQQKHHHSSLRSHVLLAACSAKEEATEYSSGGAFTSALLKELYSVGHSQVTYAELIRRLPLIPGQNPQCEGHNAGRICFDSKPPVPKRQWFGIKTGTQNGRVFYKIEAGTAHGITEGAQFAVYPTQTPLPDEAPLVHVVASVVLPYQSIIKPMSGPPYLILTQKFAAQTRAGTKEDLRLFIPKNDKDNSSFKVVYDTLEAMSEVQVDQADPAPAPVITCTKKSKAELGVLLDGSRLFIEILDPLITVHGLTRLQYPLPRQIPLAASFLRAAAHYHRYLHRIQGTSGLLDDIKIEFTELASDGNGFCKPTGDNMIGAGVVDIPVKEGVFYGVKITNTSNKDLYPSVFFFNALDLSIDSVYECAAARTGKVDSPLPAKGCLTIGYGSGGSEPFDFCLSQDVEVSLLKFFIADRYVDMSHVAQRSAFEKRGGKEGEGLHGKEDAWCTTVVSVVQRRPTN